MALPYEVSRYRKRKQLSLDGTVPGIEYNRLRGGLHPAGPDISSLLSPGIGADGPLYDPVAELHLPQGPDYQPYRGMPQTSLPPRTPQPPAETAGLSLPHGEPPSYEQSARLKQLADFIEQRDLDGLELALEPRPSFPDPLQSMSPQPGLPGPSGSELFERFTGRDTELPDEVVSYRMNSELENLNGDRPDVNEWIRQEEVPWEQIEQQMMEKLEESSSAMSGPSFEEIDQALSADRMEEAQNQLEQIVDNGFEQIQEVLDQDMQELMDPYMMPGPGMMQGPGGAMWPGGMPDPRGMMGPAGPWGPGGMPGPG